MNKSTLHQGLGYLGLVPFFVGTYYTWCGPHNEILYAGQAFTVYSIVVLSFIAGSWWGATLSSAKENPSISDRRQTILIVSSCIYACFAVGCWLLSNLSLTVTLLGFGFVGLWFQELYFPSNNLSSSYRLMRTVLTLSVFVCHVLVAVQLYQL